MKVLNLSTIACCSFLTLLMISPANNCFAESKEELQKRIKQLELENEKLRPRVKFSEVVVPRGTDSNRTNRTITVFAPENASNLKIEAFMKNEPWGGHCRFSLTNPTIISRSTTFQLPTKNSRKDFSSRPFYT